ncbi:MAG TPA: GNAT family protein [Candidatus Binatia bacterium]|nr:GNAT family protein [Candidatus Binatia bacterium]
MSRVPRPAPPRAGPRPWPPAPGLLDPRNDARCWGLAAPPAKEAQSSEPLVVARGRHVHLRTFVPQDLAPLAVWAEDPEIEYLVGSDFLRAYREIYDKQPAFYDAVLADPTQIVLMIVPNAQPDRPVGLTRLFDIHLPDGYASFETIVADPRARRRGFGVMASRLLVCYGVDTLGLRRFESRVYEYNTLSINGLLRNGFTREGVLRKAAFKSGRYWDIIIFGILRDEIEARRPTDRYQLPAPTGEGRVGDAP